jgi:hypothetical protein
MGWRTSPMAHGVAKLPQVGPKIILLRNSLRKIALKNSRVTVYFRKIKKTDLSNKEAKLKFF